MGAPPNIASAQGDMECGGSVAEVCGEPVEPDGDAALARVGRKKRCAARGLPPEAGKRFPPHSKLSLLRFAKGSLHAEKM